MKGNEIRSKFIDFFVAKGHTHVPSSSLVPFNDQTLLFTNAGMVQFKDTFLGAEQRPYKRAVTAQRCLRAGGKHNDLDTVGRTARHHTFFEMLGNFSFGDYFKKDAITFAWEFLTQELKLPVERLYITVYEKDDEAAQLWTEIAGIEPSHLFRIGEKDNFWAMGDTGPCGPCSEIFFDRGESHRCNAPECGIGKCDCDRYLEIWNLVFMQFNRDASGNLTPLPHPSIDTGMGLERVAAVLQNVESNYETDLMRGLIDGVVKLCGKPYDAGAAGFPFRVIADHARSCSSLICDGVLPSNEGRGYVLRRILRRAVRLGKTLGLDEPFLYMMVPYVSQSLSGTYPELAENEAKIADVIKAEEERFQATLQDGMAVAAQIVAKTKEQGQSQIAGEDAFLLYDTYGFPLDLAIDIANENGMTLDEKGFADAMEKQRQRARAARQEGKNWDEKQNLIRLLQGLAPTEFIGYTDLEGNGDIVAIICDGKKKDLLEKGESGFLTLTSTPFYAESGGQVGDSGIISTPNGTLKVIDTQKLPGGVFLHEFIVESGSAAVGDSIHAMVDKERRLAISRNHSATHLLHNALRRLLGEQVHQAGSLVEDDRLRFDFAQNAPMTAEQIKAVEDDVNAQVLADLPITTRQMALKEAQAEGVLAFFGDKYGDIVRMVKMGDYSKELCGGCHCSSTGQIGFIKILGESGIGSGLRRIEALTGNQSLAYYREKEEGLATVADLLKTNPTEVVKKLETLLNEHRALGKELTALREKVSNDAVLRLAEKAEEISGIRLLVAKVSAPDMPALRNTMDFLMSKIPSAVIVLAAVGDGKVQVVAGASKEAQNRGLHAGNIVKEIAAMCGGGGGGRPDMAQAGGKEPDRLDEALKVTSKKIAQALRQ